VTRYTHCPACGKPYGATAASHEPPGASAPSLLLCASCGFHFWQNSKPAVGALVLRTAGGRPEILLSRRGVQPFKDKWDFPGGFLSNGEHPEHGLARELEEELGVRAKPVRLFSMGIDEYPAEGIAEQARFVLSIFYRCDLPPDAVLSARDDVAEVRWFPLDQPPEMAFTSNVQTLADLARVWNAESGVGKVQG
jgi:ADP-ribose pyrophosphatase YjhB (NUDIX family)